MEQAKATAAVFETDPLLAASRVIFDDRTMQRLLPSEVFERFQQSVITGEPTPPEDQALIAEALFRWARDSGAEDFAHWFFPARGGGGAVGGSLGAFKIDTLIDLDWASHSASKPFKACLPPERLFQGESDGSSFPNGGMRVTHAAAAFTVWDRSSPPFIVDKVLRIPCSFITHHGKCIDEKTPLLRSMDAVRVQGLRLLKAIGVGADAKTVHSYLGWEQEFFVVPADLYLRRPDLLNCGRTLLGRLPRRHQQAELNYFGPVPNRVDELMRRVRAEVLRVGCPMSVRHNEVAPGQHEMSPIYSTANTAADSNVLFMEICQREAAKLGLSVLFHEKPFKGINGSGKHANWSIGTDTGLNFFYPGKTPEAATLYIVALACLSYGLCQYNELVRCSVAHAGNDHRLGAQEAPPAIISLYTGTGMEAHIDAVVAGGELLGYKAEKKHQSTGCSGAMAVEANVEDRNRTAPFPFCGNRFEFRAVGSSQNCSFPVMVCNTVMAAGMAHLSGLVEGGAALRDAVAQVLRENRHVIFTGNGYSAEWPLEAERRGLPNLNTTPKALAAWASPKTASVLRDMGVFTVEETEARREMMFEAYVTTLTVEVQTLVQMLETGVIPACAKDLALYSTQPRMAGQRCELYERIVDETEKLKALVSDLHQMSSAADPLQAEATFLCDSIKPQMETIRGLVDTAEGLMSADLYPFPTYEALLYSHHHC